MKNKDAKLIYAQSSDIKSRTYFEYRKDMKKKAIAELETLEWLEEILSNDYNCKVKVKKSGSDAFIWFLRSGGIKGDSDYFVEYNNIKENFEFQYSDSIDLKYFDFKVSKVGKKNKNIRKAHENKKFIYIVKSTCQYCIIEPQWIIDNGIIEGVPAWGNRTAYRIPKDVFIEKLIYNNRLEEIIKNINYKTNLLNFQFEFILNEEQKLSYLLQKVIDEKQILEIIPENFESFYRICFIIDKINKEPINSNLWLIYLFSYFDENFSSYDMSRFIYCIDFLYSKIILKQNELKELLQILKKIDKYISLIQDEKSIVKTSIHITPLEEIRNLLFIINVFEDLIQDIIYNYEINIEPVNKIFEKLKNIENIYNIIKQNK